MPQTPHSKHFLLLAFAIFCFGCTWEDPNFTSNYLPLDDSEYPYANLPRLVIETENFQQVRDRTTKVPARMQFWDKNTPQSDVMFLTIRGRGNSSWTGMPKVSYKIELANKTPLLGMPKDRDWALIANSADRTLIKNFITYKLATWLGDDYSPRSEFIELYLNRQYLGIYQLTETVKVSPNRTDISANTFLLELGSTERDEEVHVITKKGTNFNIKFPKNPSDSSLSLLRNHLTSWEYYLYNQLSSSTSTLSTWLNLEEFIRYYWIQEFSKNLDGAFRRSIYIIWEPKEPFKFGPVWDFDVAYGNWKTESLQNPEGWYVKDFGWNKPLLANDTIWTEAISFWHENQPIFLSFPDSIDKYVSTLKQASLNEFKRWPVLENTENWTYKESYKNYDEAVEALKKWITTRTLWINQNLTAISVKP